MPTVEFYKGYEVMPICGQSSSTSIEFNEFEAELSDDYEQSVLYGADTGSKRTWSVNHKLQGASGANTIVLDGASMTPADYLWDLFTRQKRTGTPFIIRDLRNDQYYLAKFADKKLTYERMLTKYFSTGVNFRRVRIPGVSVFRPELLGFWGWWNTDNAENFTASGWLDIAGNDRLLEPSNAPGIPDIEWLADAQNGKAVLRFHPEGTLGDYLILDEAVSVKQVFIVCKIREATFGRFSGVISGDDTTDPILVGDNGTTKFFNYNYSTAQKYAYEKNSVSYAESNQQAPMNQFGLVYVQARTGMPLNQLIIGLQNDDPARFALVDIGELAIAENTIADSDAREFIEHLQTIWNY